MGFGDEPHDSGKSAASLSGCRCVASAAATVRPDHGDLRGTLGFHDLYHLEVDIRRDFRTGKVAPLGSEDDHSGRAVVAGQDVRVSAAGTASRQRMGNQGDLNVCAP